MKVSIAGLSLDKKNLGAVSILVGLMIVAGIVK